MAGISQVQKLNLGDAPIQQVLVYNSESNCAQIKRTFKSNLSNGFNEIRIQNLPFDLVEDSIRVTGRGDAVIHDVSVKFQQGADMVYPERVLNLKNIMKEKESEKNAIDDKRTIVKKRVEVLDKLVEEAVKNQKEGAGFQFNANTIDSLTQLNTYYQEQSQALRVESRELDVVYQKAEEAFNKAQEDYNNTGYAWRNHTQFASIVVEATGDDAAVELEVTYQVSNVSWFPFYDVRVTTGADSEMHITYYGKIRQFSGEDWNEVPLVLSTARPARGAKQLPKLGTLEASIVKPEPEIQHEMMMCGRAMDAAPMAFGAVGGYARKMKSSVASVRKSSIATEFGISRLVSVDDRTEEFKVTIGVVTLKPKLSYVTVPSRTTAAFLIANTINTSEYPFVAGEASIFLDGTFVNKIDFSDVVVSQKFETSLGVDSAIQVDYKPVKNYQEQVGLITKSTAQATEKTIVVSNLRQEPVLLTIREQVPRSTDERIKVRLVNPAAKEVADNNEEPKEGAIINKENILDFTVKLNVGEQKTYTVKYTIEHPKTEEIRFDEKF